MERPSCPAAPHCGAQAEGEELARVRASLEGGAPLSLGPGGQHVSRSLLDSAQGAPRAGSCSASRPLRDLGPGCQPAHASVSSSGEGGQIRAVVCKGGAESKRVRAQIKTFEVKDRAGVLCPAVRGPQEATGKSPGCFLLPSLSSAPSTLGRLWLLKSGS